MDERLMQYLKGGVIKNIETFNDDTMVIAVYVEGKTLELTLYAHTVNYDENILDVELDEVVVKREKVHL